ncbi:hypothetical protein [Streptomyces sp. NBC_01142]|nr:hypothetical protein [Streptomyces sp. NBC_01142]
MAELDQWWETSGAGPVRRVPGEAGAG